MSTLTIRTNNAPRDVLTWFDLAPREQAEFDYLDTDDARSGASFFRYIGFAPHSAASTGAASHPGISTSNPTSYPAACGQGV